jgi:hypothetical protein
VSRGKFEKLEYTVMGYWDNGGNLLSGPGPRSQGSAFKEPAKGGSFKPYVLPQALGPRLQAIKK